MTKSPWAKSIFNKTIFSLFLLLILVLEIWSRWQRLNALSWNADEGIHLVVAQLVAAGHRPYSEVSFSQLPLFLEAVRLPLAWMGSVTAVRLAISLFGLLQIVAVALIGRDLHSNIAGWVAAIFLAFTPSFFYYSRAIMADIPAVALSMWACWAALRYLKGGQRRWLVISGVLMGLSLAAKFLTIYAVGWISILVFYYGWMTLKETASRRQMFTRIAQDGLLFGSCVGLTLFGVLVWYDLPALLPAAFGMRASMREVFDDGNWDVIIEFWHLHTPLIVLAGYGLAAQYRRSRETFLLLIWLGLISLSLLYHTPLHRQHMQLLPPLLAVLAGIGVGSLFEQIFSSGFSWLWSVAGVILLAWYIAFTWQARDRVTPFTETATGPLGTTDRPLADYLQRFTSPTDCLVTDDLTFAFASGRLPPPGLADVSSARLRSGNLTYSQLISTTEGHHCQIMAPIAKRIKRTRPDFVAWAQEHFLALWLYDGATEVFLAQPLTDPHPAIPLQATFSDQVDLIGADLVPPSGGLGGARSALYVSLYWQTLQPFSEDYTVFIHLRDTDNTTVVNGDHQPYNNLVPTTRWPVGKTLKETIRLDLPSDLPSGTYRLMIGLYSPQTLDRLPINHDTSGENAVIIPEVVLNP